MIILASLSPYRKNLLEKLGFAFKTEAPLVDEELLKKEYIGNPKELIAYLSFKKAESIALKQKGVIVIGADQALIDKSKVIGKAHTFEKAKAQLLDLSDKEVELVTSVSLVKHNISSNTPGDIRLASFTNTTQLKFKKLSLELIKWYLLKDEPYDCAGSFKIEKSGAALFEYIKTTDPTAIEGLPLMRLSKELEVLGVKKELVKN